MKKKIVFILSLVFLMILICGCEQKPEMAESTVDFAGKWKYFEYRDEDYVLKKFEDLHFNPEEIKFADTKNLAVIKFAEFTEDLKYSFYYDTEKTEEYIKNYYSEFFDRLYENREALSSLYTDDYAKMTREEFGVFYANLFEFKTYEELLTFLSEKTFSKDALKSGNESGTFTVDKSVLKMTKDGDDEPAALQYSLSDKTLTLYYGEIKEVYEKD